MAALKAFMGVLKNMGIMPIELSISYTLQDTCCKGFLDNTAVTSDAGKLILKFLFIVSGALCEVKVEPPSYKKFWLQP